MRLQNDSRSERLGAVWLLVSISMILLLASQSAYGEVRSRKFNPKTRTYSKDYVVRQVQPGWATAPVTVATAEAPQTRILNLRLHPIHLVQMLASQDTIVSLRADLDVVLGRGVTVGPSVLYHQMSVWDDAALSGGKINAKDEEMIQLGILSNIYVSGTTGEGGFIIRPHVYWIQPNGDRTDEAGVATTATSAKSGWRAGSEFLYQKILGSGLNFEIGAGFTYHLVPYSVEYQGGARSAPNSNIEPTISAGIGWAF